MGQAQRCSDILSELIYQRPSFVALQETKLNNLNRSSLRSFLPARLTGYAELPAQGASGGILSAWDDSVWNVRSQCVRRYTLTTNFTLYRDGTSFSVTNVYAPTNHADKPLFLHELASIAATIQEQCVIMGDFNLTREPVDKNNGNFNFREAQLFNDTINSLELLEIPLVGRAYT